MSAIILFPKPVYNASFEIFRAQSKAAVKTAAPKTDAPFTPKIRDALNALDIHDYNNAVKLFDAALAPGEPKPDARQVQIVIGKFLAYYPDAILQHYLHENKVPKATADATTVYEKYLAFQKR